MDEFDKKIIEAREQYEPRKDFVDMTMEKVKTTQPRTRRVFRFLIPATAGAALIVLAILITPLFFGHTATDSATKAPSSTAGSGSTNTTSTSGQTSTTPTVPAGTDNSSLDSDLNGVNGSMNQESSDQTSADSSVNDSSQEVSVPTS